MVLKFITFTVILFKRILSPDAEKSAEYQEGSWSREKGLGKLALMLSMDQGGDLISTQEHVLPKYQQKSDPHPHDRTSHI